MNKVVIISGCPGSGKTTLARNLAAMSEVGVHITTDDFYRYLSHRIDPSTPESHGQNTAIVRAFSKSAQSLVADGFMVYVDGVLGPWWLETIAALIPGFHYCLLHAPLATVLARTKDRARHTQGSANSALVETMHSQFELVTNYTRHTIRTEDRSSTSIVEEYLDRYSRGDFKI